MAKLPIEIHSEAHLEEVDAFRWYRDHSVSAADGFIQEIEEARSAIQDSPDSWPQYLHGTRFYRLRRYPYLVVYRVAEIRTDIIAIAHGSREPGYWVDRTSSLE